MTTSMRRYMAAMVLGDGTGSRLFWNIYQKGLAETAACLALAARQYRA